MEYWQLELEAKAAKKHADDVSGRYREMLSEYEREHGPFPEDFWQADSIGKLVILRDLMDDIQAKIDRLSGTRKESDVFSIQLGTSRLLEEIAEKLSAPDPEENRVYVYLMLNKRNGYTKIGHSRNPQFREKTLQAEDPDISLLWSAPLGKDIERALHHEFKAHRIRGEWFDLSQEQQQDIIRRYSES